MYDGLLFLAEAFPMDDLLLNGGEIRTPAERTQGEDNRPDQTVIRGDRTVWE
jgi:hypothetical protein